MDNRWREDLAYALQRNRDKQSRIEELEAELAECRDAMVELHLEVLRWKERAEDHLEEWELCQAELAQYAQHNNDDGAVHIGAEDEETDGQE